MIFDIYKKEKVVNKRKKKFKFGHKYLHIKQEVEHHSKQESLLDELMLKIDEMDKKIDENSFAKTSNHNKHDNLIDELRLKIDTLIKKIENLEKFHKN